MKLTPEEQAEYEALVASCKYHPPPLKDSWVIQTFGVIFLVFMILAADGLLETFGL